MPSLEELITPTPYFGICIEEKETDSSLFAIGIICCSNQIDTADEKALSQTRMTADKCRTNDRFRKPPIGSLLCSPSLGQGLPTDVKSISKIVDGELDNHLVSKNRAQRLQTACQRENVSLQGRNQAVTTLTQRSISISNNNSTIRPYEPPKVMW